MRVPYAQAVANLDLLERLRPFDPIVIGTPPLGIDVANSDIDIACYCDDLERFTDFATRHFQSQNRFQIRLATFQNLESAVVQFEAFEWDFEISANRFRPISSGAYGISGSNNDCLQYLLT
ncbi:hypothetical protein GCM10023156_04910 [Novipirellula rosea]|uniref:Polymerase nucleotidyl transferase domain-containing protein n=1 Tax=Novipirellula rosea TaxID=1031540 RepID=A0ABP8M916_9BACT